MDVITTHINADFDGLASMLAAKKLYPDALLAFPGGQEKNLRDFFLQSTMYAFQTEKIKNISLNKVKRLILVDIRQPGRIGKFSALCNRSDVAVHIYDHHPSSPDDISGDVEHIKPVGATATIMCQIMQQRKIALTPEEATILMLGIYEDTGNLTFSSTTPEDFEAAAYLLSCGASLNTVSDMITKELTADQVALLNELVENAYVKNINGLDVMITQASCESYVGEFSVLVHKLKDMQNANVLFAIANMDDRIYLIARSRIPEVNAADVVAGFGGGGHPTAAAVTIHNMTLTQVEQKLFEILSNTIKPVKTARDFMAGPVKTILATEPVKKVGELLTRYNINVLPVLDKNKLVGLISRQIAEKASFHGLQDVPVREYMTTEFATVKPATPLAVIQKAIIENNQRLLPVLARGKLVGAITRTDLLRALHVDTAQGEPEQVSSMHIPRKKTVNSMLRERLSKQVFSLLQDIGTVADNLGYNVYAVGGFVRDIFLRFENYDIDIVVEGDGIQFTRTFSALYPCTIKVHRKFGTGVILLPGGLKVDVASARLEYYEHPAALPKVEWSSIKLDLYRRDFTINTLAVQLNRISWGNLIDFFGAARDIKEKFIRVLHNLSFVEDPSRIFRAIRFEQRLSFRFSKLTRSLIENTVKMEFIKSLSGKRVFMELQLILHEEKILSIIKRMAEFGLLSYIHPSIQYNVNLKAVLKNCHEVLSWFDLLFLDKACERWLVFFLALTDQLSLADAEALCTQFHINKRHADNVKSAKSQGLEVLKWMLTKRSFKSSDLYRRLNDLPVEVCLYIMAKTNHPVVKRAVSLYFTHLQNISVHVKGDDLIRMGIKPGKIYKRILDDLHDVVLDEKVAGRDSELAFIRKKYAHEIE
jgi:tRNA nucleotidyltransferase (CCA-adding enzyme)